MKKTLIVLSAALSVLLMISCVTARPVLQNEVFQEKLSLNEKIMSTFEDGDNKILSLVRILLGGVLGISTYPIALILAFLCVLKLSKQLSQETDESEKISVMLCVINLGLTWPVEVIANSYNIGIIAAFFECLQTLGILFSIASG